MIKLYLDEAFDAVAQFVAFYIVWVVNTTIGFGWYDRLDFIEFKVPADTVGIRPRLHSQQPNSPSSRSNLNRP